MADKGLADKGLTADNVDDLVASVDTGARNPDGWLSGLIPTIAFVWAVFQLYIASNLPFWLTEHARSGPASAASSSPTRMRG